jgi:hypothetical protein
VFSFLPVSGMGLVNPEGYIALSLFPHLSVLSPLSSSHPNSGAPSPAGKAALVTPALHYFARAHWSRCFAPHRVTFLPRLSDLAEEAECAVSQLRLPIFYSTTSQR